jgi:hypothetical protein
MAKQLDQSLSVAQDSRFQRVAKNRVGNNKRQDRGNPTSQKNRKDDLETIEPAVPSFRCCCASQLHACVCEKIEYHGQPADCVKQGRMSAHIERLLVRHKPFDPRYAAS